MEGCIIPSLTDQTKRHGHLGGGVDARDIRNFHLVVIQVNHSVNHVFGALRHVKMVHRDFTSLAINNLSCQDGEHPC
jgi:hypothetical protein